MVAEVFISYAARDRIRVLSLVKRLREAGVSVWIDQSGIDVSSMWSQEIVSAIKGCKVMLLSISPNSTESENVVKELALCSERKKPIIPVYLKPSEIPETMEYQLAGIQRVEYFEHNEEAAFTAILRSLAKRDVFVSENALREDQKYRHELPDTPAVHNQVDKSARQKVKFVLSAIFLVTVGFTLALLLRPGKNSDHLTGYSPVSNPEELAKPKEHRSSLAIIPFRNIGPVGERSFLAEGMHEEINAMLSMAPNLIVKDGKRFKESTLGPKDIGISLNVDSVLTGSVMQSDGKLRVIVKLVDSATETNLWAKTFDKTKGDFFKVQREIAENVAEGLSISLSSEYKSLITERQTNSLEAYNLYLEGRSLWNSREKEKMYKAVEKYELAIFKDPQFALGYVGIAECYNMLSSYHYSPPKIAYPKAKRYLEEALEINENISELHSSLGWYYWNYEYDFDRAEASLHRALSINPNSPEANRWYAQLRSIRLNPASIEEIKRAVMLEPNSPITRSVQFMILTSFSRLTEAKVVAAKVRELDSEHTLAHFGGIEVLCLEKKYREALTAVEEVMTREDKPFWYGVKGFVLGKLGRKEEAYSAINSLKEMSSKDNVPAMFIATIYYAVGAHEKAIAVMKNSINNKTFNTYVWDPRKHWKDLHDNESFKKLYSDIGLPITF